MAKPLRILILEDSPTDAELVQFELQEAGFIFTPVVVKTEKDYIREIQESCPDLILSDYDLPAYNGALALAEAKRKCPDTPFILVTGAVSEDRAIEILTQGAKDYVLKTRLQQRLVPAVRRALAEAEEHRARKQAEEELRETHRTLEGRVMIRTAELEAEMEVRKKTQEALQDSEKRYRRLFEASKEGVLILDADTGKVVDVNPFLLQLLGYSYDALCGKYIWELGEFKDIAASKYAFKTLQDKEYVQYDDLPLETNDGQCIAVEFVSNVYLVDHRKVVQCNIRDITKRKKTDEALRKSEHRYRDLFNSMQEGFYIAKILYDEDGKPQDYLYLDINPVFERIMGISRDQIVGKRLKELTPDVSSHWLNIFKKVVLTGTPAYSEFYSKSFHRYFKAMAYRPFEGQFAVLVDDITERKQAEAEIAHMASFPMLNPNPIIEMDLTGKILFCNPAAESLFPDLRQQEQGHPLLADWEAIVHSIYESNLKDIIMREVNIRGHWYQQAIHYVEVMKCIRIYGSDITLWKEAEKELMNRAAQLEDANEELESFSYSVSHDLRAPLRAIDGFSRIILRQQEDKFDEEIRHQFNLIRENTKMMGVLIDDLLSFSKVQKTDMKISVIDMDQLARKVWHEILTANKERELELRITEILSGYGDQTLIRQVLVNLISNTIKFTRDRKPGIVEISSYKQGDKVVYCLKDNGAGFDMAHYDKLFGVFQRLHSSEEYEGTGVGLAIVQRIVRRHRGHVWAESEVDKGATFYFTLSSTPQTKVVS